MQFHLIGIKGAGMSALASILSDQGHVVQGSDIIDFVFTQKSLEKKEIPIYPFSKNNIQSNQIVVISSAYTSDHEEYKEAKRLGCKIHYYHEYLGMLSNKYKSIAVSGTHGKTTTTGLCQAVLETNNLSYLIGDGTGCGQKETELFLFEACEYQRHFLNYNPEYGIITNIDYDHPDYYQNIEDVKEAFQSFVYQIKKGVVACGDDLHIRSLDIRSDHVFYGFDSSNDLIATKLRTEENGTHFFVRFHQKDLGEFHISLFGKHNVLNALAVIGLNLLLNKDLNQVKQKISQFSGVRRRFSEKIIKQHIFVDDYAHHPNEIRATLDAARKKYKNKKIIAIFQPHTYTRTKMFLREFSEVLQLFDKVYLCPIFGSTREKQGDITVEHLLNKVSNAQLFSESKIEKILKIPESVLLFMGAGNIQEIEQKFYQKIVKE